jgi:hypothetical protein
MSRSTQLESSVYGTMTATSPKYLTFDDEAEYKNWFAEFDAQNANGQRVIDFRVRYLHNAYGIHLNTSHCRPTYRQTPWNLNALRILKGASTLTRAVLICISSTSLTRTAHATMSQISTSTFTSAPGAKSAGI